MSEIQNPELNYRNLDSLRETLGVLLANKEALLNLIREAEQA